MSERTLEAMRAEDRAAAIRWAKEVLADERTVILDSETTGLYPPVDFVEIGIVDREGRQIFHSLLKPHCKIGKRATEVHGYTVEDLRGMPRFSDLFLTLREVIKDRRVVVYNADYDRMVFAASGKHYGIYDNLPLWECAMLRYAEFVGDWSERRQSYRWQRLEGGDHSAIGDARACLAVIREMAGES